jgi:hypothetical protein
LKTILQQYCNGIATELQQYRHAVHLETIFRFMKVLRGNAYATIISVSLRNGFRFAKRFHPFAMIMQQFNLEKLGLIVIFTKEHLDQSKSYIH